MALSLAGAAASGTTSYDLGLCEGGVVRPSPRGSQGISTDSPPARVASAGSTASAE